MGLESIFYPSHFLIGVLAGGPLVGPILTWRNDRILGRERPLWFTTVLWSVPILLAMAWIVLLQQAARPLIDPSPEAGVPGLGVGLGVLHALFVAVWFRFAQRSYQEDRRRHPPADAVAMVNIVMVCMLVTGSIGFLLLGVIFRT